jgi:hypothetical protein
MAIIKPGKLNLRGSADANKQKETKDSSISRAVWDDFVEPGAELKKQNKKRTFEKGNAGRMVPSSFGEKSAKGLDGNGEGFLEEHLPRP